MVVARVGDGAAALSGSATAVFLDEYTPGGMLVQSIALPTAVSGANAAFRGAAFAPAAGVVTPAPTITSFTPTSGAVGTTVTLTGTNLTGATALTLNGAAVTDFSAAAVPTITSFTPTTGGPDTAVTITGTNFTGAMAVRIGSFAVTNFTVVSATSITLVVPGGTGSVSGFVTVVTPGGTATSAATFNLISATLAGQALPGLLVFPNPTTDRFTVVLPTAGPATVALHDLAGRLVLAPTALAADQQLRLPATLAAGTYLLEVRQGVVSAVRRVQKN